MKISVWARSGATPSVRGIHCSKTTSKAPEPVCCCMVVAGAQSRKIFTCPRNVGTRSCSRPGFHLGAPPVSDHQPARCYIPSACTPKLGGLGLAWRARAGGLPRPLEGGTTGQRQPHQPFRAREKAQDRRSEPEACPGATPRIGARAGERPGGILGRSTYAAPSPDLGPIPPPIVAAPFPAPIT